MRDSHDDDQDSADYEALKLAVDQLADGSKVPKLQVMVPGQDAPIEFRNKAFVLPDSGDDQNPADQIYFIDYVE